MKEPKPLNPHPSPHKPINPFGDFPVTKVKISNEARLLDQKLSWRQRCKVERECYKKIMYAVIFYLCALIFMLLVL